MKIIFYLLLLALSMSVNAQVGINADNSNPDPSAMLDVKRSIKTVLFPSSTHAERDAIHNPTNGLHLLHTNCRSIEDYTTIASLITHV